MGVLAPAQLGLRHWAPVFRDVVLLHEPGAWTARSPEELEGDEGLQERCLPLAQVSRREGRRAAFACVGLRAHGAHEGAGRLHRREGDRAFQGRYLPVLSGAQVLPVAKLLVVCTSETSSGM